MQERQQPRTGRSGERGRGEIFHVAKYDAPRGPGRLEFRCPIFRRPLAGDIHEATKSNCLRCPGARSRCAAATRWWPWRRNAATPSPRQHLLRHPEAAAKARKVAVRTRRQGPPDAVDGQNGRRYRAAGCRSGRSGRTAWTGGFDFTAVDDPATTRLLERHRDELVPETAPPASAGDAAARPAGGRVHPADDRHWPVL